MRIISVFASVANPYYKSSIYAPTTKTVTENVRRAHLQTGWGRLPLDPQKVDERRKYKVIAVSYSVSVQHP